MTMPYEEDLSKFARNRWSPLRRELRRSARFALERIRYLESQNDVMQEQASMDASRAQETIDQLVGDFKDLKSEVADLEAQLAAKSVPPDDAAIQAMAKRIVWIADGGYIGGVTNGGHPKSGQQQADAQDWMCIYNELSEIFASPATEAKVAWTVQRLAEIARPTPVIADPVKGADVEIGDAVSHAHATVVCLQRLMARIAGHQQGNEVAS